MAKRHVKRGTTLLIQEKCTLKQWAVTSHLLEWPSSKSLQITDAGENVEKNEPSYTIGSSVNWYSHYGKEFANFLKKQKTQLKHDPAIPLPGVYPEKNENTNWKRSTHLTAALFTIQDMGETQVSIKIQLCVCVHECIYIHRYTS